MEAGGDRKKMLEILTRFGTADYFSEQTDGIINNKRGFTAGWMDRPLSVHNNEMRINRNKPLILSSAFDFGGNKINVGLDNLDNWVKAMEDINQHTTYLPEGMEAGFTPYTPGSTSSITSNNDLSSFNYDSSYWNMDNMPKFEFVYPQNLGEQFKNTDLYTGTLSGVPSLWTINLEDGLGTYYTTEYGVD